MIAKNTVKRFFLPGSTTPRRAMCQLLMILAITGWASTSSAIQFVDVGFESPAHMEWATTIGGIIYDKVYEDDLTYYCVSEEAGTNQLWISGSNGYKGTRSLAARCFAFDTPVKDRAEFRSVMWTQPYALTFGQEMYYGYAMKIASGSHPTNGMHVMQAWQGNCGPRVPITFSYDTNQSSQWKYNVDVRTLTSTTTIGSFVFNPGDWYKLVWKLAPGYPGFGGGAIDLWINDSHIVSWQGDWGIEPGITNGAYGVVVTNLDLRCGIYRGHQATEQVLLFDQIKYADSYYEADPDTEIEWGFGSGAEGWTVREDVGNFTNLLNCIAGDLSGGDPSLYSPDNLNLDCSEISNIRIKMKNMSSGGQSAIFFTTDSSVGFSADKRLDASLVENDADYTVYEFNALEKPAWNGTLKRLRFDPTDDATTNGSFSIDFIDLSSYGDTISWDGGAADSDRWGTAANWSPDVAPNAEDDFVFTGNSISVLGSSIIAKSLKGGAGSTLRVRSSGQSLTGNLILTNSAILRLIEGGAMDANFSVNGSTTLGGTGFRLLVDHADDRLTLDFDAVTLSASSTIAKQGAGDLVFNAISMNANGNAIEVDTGKLTLGGTADYSGLIIDVTGVSGSGKFAVSNSIILKGLIILGDDIATGVYPPGNAIYTTYASRLINEGGTLTIGISWDGGANDSARWGTAANWNPDITPNAGGDFVFTGNSISVLSASITANSLVGGAWSTLRVRNSGQSLTGDLILTNSAIFRLVESGAVDVNFSVNGSTTLGGTGFRFLVDHADDELTLDFDAMTFLASSTIEKQGAGDLTLNATSLNANGNTIEIDTGKLRLGGTADYSGLTIDVTGASGSGKLVISNSITLKGVTIAGVDIDDGVYAPGNTIYTTYGSCLINEGGTLTVGDAVSGRAFTGYELWVDGTGLVPGGNDAPTDNPDGDALNNLYEYGLGGDPTNGADIGLFPTFENDSGTLVYVHPQLSDPDSGLSYYLEISTDLAAGTWVDAGYTVAGTNISGGDLDFVTNVIGTMNAHKFIRLIIE